jgi:hypothetical protein
MLLVIVDSHLTTQKPVKILNRENVFYVNYSDLDLYDAISSGDGSDNMIGFLPETV